MSEADFKQAEEFARLAAELYRDDDQPTAQRVVELAVATIDGCDYCGISLKHQDGSVTTPAATDPLVAKTDELQYEYGEGPCLDAIWKLGTYLIEDMTHEHRWPRWSPAVAAMGIGAVLSLRLDTGSEVIGGLNLYAGHGHAFDAVDLETAGIFAQHAAVALSMARERLNLRAAIRSRQVIGVAQGMLMQRYHVTLDQSFHLLSRYSQTHNIKLRVMAENLVRAGSIPDTTGNGNDALSALLGETAPPEPDPTT